MMRDVNDRQQRSGPRLWVALVILLGLIGLRLMRSLVDRGDTVELTVAHSVAVAGYDLAIAATGVLVGLALAARRKRA